MRPCSVCGNEIPEQARTCPFCERPQQPPSAPRRSRDQLATINLKQGMPSVADALSALDLRLQTCRASGVRILRVVHGWGSTGHGGAIAVAVRNQLRGLQSRGRIRSFIAGEDYSEFTDAGRAILERHPSLRAGFAKDRLNRGITLVEP